MKKISLTGDRPSGCLHLGHYAGSLVNRLKFQYIYDQFIIIADFQAITPNCDKISDVNRNIIELMKDYLSIGLDPTLNTFCLQTSIPALHEITAYYSNLVTMARLQRNPTLKQELIDKNFISESPVSFFCHPISQAADITAFQADVVPVGEDQKPLIEQSNEIVRKFKHLYNSNCIKEVEAILSDTVRLSGIDGGAKASKSLNNCIFLSDSSKVLKDKVFKMYTDPNHIHINDPGNVNGNIVFEYLDAFYSDKNHLDSLKQQYANGGLGDIYLKNLLFTTLDSFMEPIRIKRSSINEQEILEILYKGTERANIIANKTLAAIKKAMGILKI